MHPACRNSPPYSPPVRMPVFGWLLCVYSLGGGRLRPWCISCLFIFHCSIRCLKQWDDALPHAITHTRLLSNIFPTASANYWLVVVLHWSNGGQLRPRPHPSLCFSMGCVLAPQTKEPTTARAQPMPRVLYGPIGSSSAKLWVHGGCCHRERGPNPLKGRAAWLMLVVVCWLCFVLWLAVEYCILPIL
jgi:hypothetical protein